MKTLADLRKIKEKAQKEMAARGQAAKYRICVGMGTCGIAAGSRSVMTAIVDEIGKRNLKNVLVTQTGCLGYCDQEPMVKVTQSDNSSITYGKVTPEIARKIIKEHIVNHHIVSEYVFTQS